MKKNLAVHLFGIFLLIQLFICHEIHAKEGGDIQTSLHEILGSQYMVQNFGRYSEAEEEILSGYTKNNPFEVLTYLCRNTINVEDAVPRFYHKIFLACKSVEDYERFIETILSARYQTVRYMALISVPVYDLPTDQQNVFFAAVINVMHKETIRDDGELACLRLLVQYFENPFVEKWWRETSANTTSHYHLDAVLAMVGLYSWEDSREFAIRQFQENRNDMKYARSVIMGLKARLWRLTDRDSLKIDLDIPAEDLNQMIEIIINGSPLGYFRTESVRMESLTVLVRALYFESGGENNSELLLMLYGLTDNPRHKEKLLARYFEVAQPRSIMREYQRDKYSDILYSASFLELFNKKLRENREKKRLLDTDFIPVLLNEISDRTDDENGLMEVLKSFEELLKTELRFRSR